MYPSGTFGRIDAKGGEAVQNKRSWAFQILFLLLVMGATAWGLFHGSDLHQLAELLRQANWHWWLAGLGLVVLFIGGESLILHDIFGTLNAKHRLSHCFLYSFIGFFFSCITPSAGGGQPAQAYFMRKDQIPVSLSVPVLMLVTITYKLVLVIYAGAVLLLRPRGVIEALDPVWGWALLGLVLNVAFIGLYLLLVFRPALVERFLGWCIRVPGRLLREKRQKSLQRKLGDWMVKYRHVADCFRDHKGMLLRVTAVSVLQRSLLFAVTYLAMRSFGLEGDLMTVVTLQAMISLGTDLLPLPGGMGASETMFLLIFPALCGEMTLPVLLVSRGLSYYGQLMISAVFTAAAVWIFGRETENGKDLVT